MKIAHLATVDLSLRYLISPQLDAATELGPVYAISAPGPYVQEIEEMGVTHVPLRHSTRGTSLRSDLKVLVEFWRAIRTLDLDVLHTHNPKPGVYGRILGRVAGIPIVVNTVHGLYASPDSPVLKKALVYALEGIAARFSDMELVQNVEDLELMRRLRIAPRNKLRLLGNGVDLSKFNPNKARVSRLALREEFGIGDDELVVGFVGRLVEEKGIPELVEAISMLEVSPRVLVAGPDDIAKGDAVTGDLVERARDAGIDFVGMRSDIDAFYGAIDVFVLPSHREGFPRAAMEAAASGLPLILTDIRGCRQVVEHGRNGLLVPVRDPEALAAAITELLGSDEMRARMGQESAKMAITEFDEAKVVEIVLGTYRELAQRKGLGWSLVGELAALEIRPAVPSDAVVLAELHRRSISSGFLSTLPKGFLRLLYRALIASERGHVFVAESAGVVVGFVAGTDDTSLFYREFVRNNLIEAVLRLLPVLIRPSAWTKVWETLRYGAKAGSNVRAELLSMVVAPTARRQGLGMRLVDALTSHSSRRGIGQMRVVLGADNVAARHLYGAVGFRQEEEVEVHTGVASLEMVWRS
jgi:glycosyltransferase involved in cell wall biosynthesis/ribosomal protein S18 acetylase RimI-like enzyme